MTVEPPPEEESSSVNELEKMKMYTVSQVADVFGVSDYTVRTWLNTPSSEGGMRGTKVGVGNTGRWRVSKEEMIRFASDKFGGDLPNE